MINWEDAKPGSRAKLRCGGEITIKEFTYGLSENFVQFEPSYGWFFQKDGYLRKDKKIENPFDIIEIIPAPEPKRETVTLYGSIDKYGANPFIIARLDHHQFVITFDAIDGVPDCSSVKMEKIDG